MGVHKRDSLVWRLLLVLGGAFALTLLVVILLINPLVRRVVHDSGLDVYRQRVEAIVREVDREAARLDLAEGQADQRAAVQDATLQNLVEVYYREAEPSAFPFIVDGSGVVQMHPWYPRGDRAFHQQITDLQDQNRDDGEFAFTGRGGRDHVAVIQRHPAWDWYVAYRVPESMLMADADRIRNQLLLAWILASGLALVGVAWLLVHEMRPLRDLTNAAAAMAHGDLDAEVDAGHTGEVGVLARGFVEMREAIRRRLAELRESESRYRRIFDAMADGMLLLDQDGLIVAANPRAAQTYGWSPENIVGRPVTDLLREGDHELAQTLRTPPADKPVQLEGLTRDRRDNVLETEIAAVRLSFNGRPHALVVLRDITQQRQLERQLIQSQKLESVGRLAGGIAHDFNNLLTPILGYSEMLMDDPAVDDGARRDLSAIRRAGERARKLARQLLAFSRRQILDMKNVNLGQVVSEFEPILRRTLREDIEVVLDSKDDDYRVHADVSQIEQIVMNLAINAMDAMSDGGRIEITTSCVTLEDPNDHDAIDLPPGRYSKLVVRDTGPGIPREIFDRLFEPFFTTKEAGKGTGLGLATTHGIVSQHGGWIGLRNHDQGGCEVEVLLPCSPEPIVRSGDDDASGGEKCRGEGEVVLLVEDDEMVRSLAETLLEKHGYRVRAYETGQRCLDDIGRHDRPGDAVLTDVVMPVMNGPELRDRLRAAGHTMPVLFMSGYAGEILVDRGLAEEGVEFVVKPLDSTALLNKLHDLLATTRATRHRT